MTIIKKAIDLNIGQAVSYWMPTKMTAVFAGGTANVELQGFLTLEAARAGQQLNHARQNVSASKQELSGYWTEEGIKVPGTLDIGTGTLEEQAIALVLAKWPDAEVAK